MFGSDPVLPLVLLVLQHVLSAHMDPLVEKFQKDDGYGGLTSILYGYYSIISKQPRILDCLCLT